MTVYREDSTGRIQIRSADPGTGWTNLGAASATLEGRAAWFRGLDLNAISSTWHPSDLQRDASGNPIGEKPLQRGLAGSGVNILPRDFSICDNGAGGLPDYYLTSGFVATYSGWYYFESTCLYLQTGSSAGYVGLTETSLTHFNLRINPGRRWIFSFYMHTNTAFTLKVRLKLSDGNYIENTITTPAGEAPRVVMLFDMSAINTTSQTGLIYLTFPANITSAYSLTMDQFMFEEQIGDTFAASAFSPGVG